ncbi:MAG: hypothetical protein QM750_03405 [Rubrivivax sp.]
MSPNPSARVALLDALIQVLHAQRALAAGSAGADPLAADPQPARCLAAWTEQLQQDGLVSPGELCVMHQRAQAAAQRTTTTA